MPKFNIPIVRIFSDDAHNIFFKDLDEEVIREMGNRIEAGDHATRRILQSFGIPDPFHGRIPDIFHLFPDTPVKLLRDVCEALQYYDLVDLLAKPISNLTKSLRPVLTLDEVRKLRKTDGRPIYYHSRAAVLIFADSDDDSNVKSCETFFKSLNIKSEVNIIQCRDLLTRELQLADMNLSRAKEEVQRLQRSIEKGKRGEQSQQVEDQTNMMELTSELQMRRQKVEQLEKELKETEVRSTSTVIDKWIQRQGWCEWRKVKSLKEGRVEDKGLWSCPKKSKGVWL